ncbi:MAG: phosphoribosylanthranilate isomerase [Enterocloster sp.]
METCRLKICGLSRMEDIRAANAVKPDFIGFVFAKSRRQVSREQARRLKAALSPDIPAVGVFVNAPPEEILPLADEAVIDMIQLHGDEDEAYIRYLKQRTRKPVLKAVRVRSREQIQEAVRLPCDYLLLDTFVKGQYGGSGFQFDWSLIPKMEKPFFLAGGIGPENLKEAVACGPYAIDISSAVETEGHKDEKKMREFAELFRKLAHGI